MQRRHFLRRATSALALASFPNLAHSASPSGLKLGFSLYGMKTLALADALKTCAEIGYQSVEFALNAGYVTEPTAFDSAARKEASELLAALHLELPCLMLNLSLTADDKAHATNLASIAAAGQMAQELQPDHPPIIETVLGGKPAAWEQIKESMAARLQDWAEAATKAKTTIAIKAHVGSAVNSPERLLWLIEKVKSPAIVVAYDYSHFELAGIDMAESMKLLLPHTKFIHVKDTVGDSSKFKFLLPGEGHTDYAAYFKALKAYNYTGPVVVEVSGQIFNQPGYEPIAAAKKCYTALSDAMAKAAP
jgi:sugar phosphate isomerase/epimerase